MYNRYLPNEAGCHRIPEGDAPPRRAAGPHRHGNARQRPPTGGDVPLEGIISWVRKAAKKLCLEELDTGDILLVLILLFLFLESEDNLELVITLGLLLLFGLYGDGQDNGRPNGEESTEELK